MPLTHLPVTESDIPAWNSAKETAFATTLHNVMWPQGISPTTRGHLNNKMREQLQDPEIKFFKVIDTELTATTPSDSESHGNIVGIAKWALHPYERSESELDAADAEAETAGYPPGMGEAFARAFFGGMRVMKRENLGGRPYVNLHILAVLPEHRGRGIAQMLLQRGLEEAEGLGLPVYLESTPMGKGLYEKWGFEVLNWLPFDAREFGGEEPLFHACMLRPVGAEERAR